MIPPQYLTVFKRNTIILTIKSNTMNNEIAVFEQKRIHQKEHNGETYFSVVDIIDALTDSPNPRNYWSMLKKREEQLYTICVQLKLEAPDGKQRLTDCTNTEGVLRVIMYTPSPKVEPFVRWFADLTY
jgi:DNA-damage-inducible protein D